MGLLQHNGFQVLVFTVASSKYRYINAFFCTNAPFILTTFSKIFDLVQVPHKESASKSI